MNPFYLKWLESERHRSHVLGTWVWHEVAEAHQLQAAAQAQDGREDAGWEDGLPQCSRPLQGMALGPQERRPLVTSGEFPMLLESGW